jgi:hypothetical protein
MPMRVVEIATLDQVAGFALLKNPHGKPAATFNLTLNQPKTQGTCRPINGIQGTIAIDTATTTDLLMYVGVEFQFHWSDDIIVKTVDVAAV